jgi:hypothetical protein
LSTAVKHPNSCKVKPYPLYSSHFRSLFCQFVVYSTTYLLTFISAVLRIPK